jgi:hypothetical protein
VQISQKLGVKVRDEPVAGLRQRHKVLIGQTRPVNPRQRGGELRAGWHHRQVLWQPPPRPVHVLDDTGGHRHFPPDDGEFQIL